MAFDDKDKQFPQVVDIITVMKVFEMAETDMRSGHSDQNGGGFAAFPPYFGAAAQQTERPRAGNAKRRQRLAGQIFPDRGAERVTAVQRPRIRRQSCAFQLDFVGLPVHPLRLAQGNSAAIAQL